MVSRGGPSGRRRNMTPDQIAELRRQKYNATLVYLHKTHSDLMIVRIRPDVPRPPHRPGQYTALGLGYWEPRFPGCQVETISSEEEPRWPGGSLFHQLLDPR